MAGGEAFADGVSAGAAGVSAGRAGVSAMIPDTSGDVPGARPNSSYVTASLGWQRELGPGVRGNAQLTYSTREAGPRLRQETMTFTSGLNWSLSETLSTRASYTYTRANSNIAGFGYAAHLVALGVQKSF